MSNEALAQPRLAQSRLAQSRHIFLRHPERDDVESFLQFVTHNRSFHRPWVHPPDTPEKFSEYYDRLGKGHHESFFICRTQDAALVGVVNLNEIVRGGFQNVYLGYYGARRFARQGLMTEGLRLVIRYAFTQLKLHRLEANIIPDNAPSLALAKRVGMRLEGFSPRYLKIAGRWRDHERWAMTVEDWRERRSTVRARRTGT